MSEPPDNAGKLRVVFLGTPRLAVPTLAAVAGAHDVVAVVTQPDRRAGRGRRLEASSVKEWATAAGVPVRQPERVRDDGTADWLRRVAPDVVVVVAFGQILPPDVLAIPRLGCINLHASLLPRHRGASPIRAAILSGDGMTGVTTMLMDEGLDTGPILLRREEAVRHDDTAGTLGARLAGIGAALMLATLAGLAKGTVEAQRQDAAEATMTRLIRKRDGAIDWGEPAAGIDRRVRAMQPWPVAYGVMGGDSLKVWEVAVGPATEAAAGTVLRADEELVVACGQRESVRLLEIQRAGGRRLPAADFLRGKGLTVGDRFVASGHGD